MEEKAHLYDIENKKLEIDIEEKRSNITDRQWKSCCFNLHPESSGFFAKLIISVMTIIICAYQLITLKECQFQSLYSSILSSVIIFWLSGNKHY